MGWLAGLIIVLGGCQSSEIAPEKEAAIQRSQGPVARLTQALLIEPDDEVSQMGLVALQEDSLPGIEKLLASNDPNVRFAAI